MYTIHSQQEQAELSSTHIACSLYWLLSRTACHLHACDPNMCACMRAAHLRVRSLATWASQRHVRLLRCRRFGHLGDSRGRRVTLLWSILCVSVSSPGGSHGAATQAAAATAAAAAAAASQALAGHETPLDHRAMLVSARRPSQSICIASAHQAHQHAAAAC